MDAVIIRSFRRSDQTACQKICLDGWQEFIRNVTLDVLSKSLWSITIATVFASLAGILWSTWILVVHICIVFSLCAFFCIILQISSRQLINCWLKTDLKDIQKWYMSDEGSNHMWVAEWRGKVVGMVGLLHEDSDGLGTYEMKRMYVVSRCRGVGIGAKLLNEMIAHAKRKKFDKIVSTTSATQLPAIRLYRKYGFKQAIGSDDRSVYIPGIYKESGQSVHTSARGKQSEGSIYTSMAEVVLKKVAGRIRLELFISSTVAPLKVVPFASVSLEGN